jgi:hypothetical protein
MDIDEKIKEAEKNLKNLKEEKSIIEKKIRASKYNSLDIKIAEYLHERLCHHNHTDMCGWYYGEWSDEVLRGSRKEYIEKAYKLRLYLNSCGINDESVLYFIKGFVEIIK